MLDLKRLAHFTQHGGLHGVLPSGMSPLTGLSRKSLIADQMRGPRPFAALAPKRLLYKVDSQRASPQDRT
jgi:hypothetical protein